MKRRCRLTGNVDRASVLAVCMHGRAVVERDHRQRALRGGGTVAPMVIVRVQNENRCPCSVARSSQTDHGQRTTDNGMARHRR